ncbi:MAG: 4-alpha-glucanotransferase [Clostridiales bacterium]|nr:MAG: 4-alpha-glucanotransferase [Clostridiales bacterium]
MDSKYNYTVISEERYSGVLMHISSLPSKYGIGTLGKKAYEFADFLDESGQKYWQMLPVGPTGYGDSPYQSFSSFAGNPYFIDLDILREMGLLTKNEIGKYSSVKNPKLVDYRQIYDSRYKLLKIAYDNFDKNDLSFLKFKTENNFWLQDYTRYTAIKKVNHELKWNEWPDKYKKRYVNALSDFDTEHYDEINFQSFMQYMFFKQWKELKSYVNKKGIELIGDLPIYVAEDSCDVWVNPELFHLNKDLTLKFVGGCPPDDFSLDGQLWGNPSYKWNAHKKDNYKWWIRRIKWIINMFDMIRIDHFRGFESYWRIPSGDKTARNGCWRQGPGIELFNCIKEELGDLPIIAEDLGYLTKEVHQFREDTGFPGMKILQFAFDPTGKSEHIPHNYKENIVVYPGTHDNYTINGWKKEAFKHEVEMAKEYFGIEEEDFHWGMIRGAMTSVAKTSIFQMQDILGFDNSARMNKPGVLGEGNWCWRMKNSAINDKIINKLYRLTKMTNRLKDKEKSDVI